MPNAIYIVSVCVAQEQRRADVVFNVPAQTDPAILSALCAAATAVASPLMCSVGVNLGAKDTDASASCQLSLAADSPALGGACDQLAQVLFEEFPEASLELIRDLLLRALDGGAVCARGSAALARDGVGGLEICLDTARIVEFLASALRAGQGNRVAHGQPLSELIDVEERQSYPGRAGRHVPGDTTTPDAPGAIWIGSGDA